MKSHKVALIGIILTSTLVLGACAGTGNTAAVEQAPETAQEAPAEPTPTPTPTPEPEPEEEEAPEAPEDDLTDVLYADEFTPAAWADFGSEEKSGEHGDDLICVRGTIGDYDDDKHTLTLKAADGDWTVNCGQALSYAFNEMMVDLRGEEMRVFGTYAGFSASTDTPRISFIKGAPEHACRMESIDGEKRITYLDSIWENLRADKDYALGHITWKGISDWETDNETEDRDGRTISYVDYTPVEDYSARIRVYYEELPDDLKDWKKADDVFEEIMEGFFEGEEIESTRSCNVAGLEGRRVTSTIKPKSLDHPMGSDTYILLDTDAYYAIMFAEPYFTGSMMNTYAEELLETVEYSETEAEAGEAEEEKKEEEEKKQDDAKTGTTNSSTSSSTSNNSSSNKKKTGYPKYGDIMGTYLFTMSATITNTETGDVTEDGGSGTDEIDGGNLVSYNEDTGMAIMLHTLFEGDSRAENIPTYFSWMDNGKVQFEYYYEFDYEKFHYTIHKYAYMP